MHSISCSRPWACFAAAALLAWQGLDVECLAQSPGEPKSDKGAGGYLVLEGKSVESISIFDKNGNVRQLWPKGGTRLLLPAGEYQLSQIQLQNNYYSFTYPAERFKITTGGETLLAIGAPLSPSIKTTRQGRVLRLDYELTDQGRHGYANTERAQPPRFTIYKDGQEVNSGSFEYG